MISRLLSSLVFFTVKLISYLPLSWLYGISGFTAFILRRLVGYRRNVIIQNLSRSFPELKYREIDKIANQFYLHFTDVFIEVIKSISIRGNSFRKRYLVENPELLIKYYQDNKNVIALTGHIANWEWLSIIPTLYPFPCFTLYKPLRSKVAEGIMTQIRLRFGMKLLPMAIAARYILSNKDKNGLYIFIGDQSPVRIENAHQFNFLNQKTTFFTGGAKLARATQAVVVYISIRKVSRGKYTLRFIPIEATDNHQMNQPIGGITGANQKENLELSILEGYIKLLENDIVSNPVHWLWSHKRWKH